MPFKTFQAVSGPLRSGMGVERFFMGDGMFVEHHKVRKTGDFQDSICKKMLAYVTDRSVTTIVLFCSKESKSVAGANPGVRFNLEAKTSPLSYKDLFLCGFFAAGFCQPRRIHFLARLVEAPEIVTPVLKRTQTLVSL